MLHVGNLFDLWYLALSAFRPRLASNFSKV